MTDDDQSFAALLAESEASDKKKRRVTVGEQVRGQVVEIGSDTAFVNIGAKAEAIIELAEFTTPDGENRLAIGDEIEARVADDGSETGTIILRRTLGRGGHTPAELEQAFAAGIAVEGTVTGQNKGGYDVQVAGLRGFCPGSQIDLRRNDAAVYVGQRFRFKITKLENNGRNVVVSRRAVLEEEAAQLAATTWDRVTVGAVVSGTVVSFRDFGAFVDLGGVEGLIHVSELGYARAKHPADVLQVGQKVDAQVLKVEPAPDGRRRVSLSLRALAPDPWVTIAQQFPVGTVVRGKVQRLEQFGAFVELTPGVEGLVHISQMALDRRIAHARQAAEVGQEVDVTVTAIDTDKKRISLSMSAQARNARDAVERAEQRETEQLMEQSNAQSASLGTFGELLRSSQPKRK
jgi:small subunit ribosomal protein S1